MKTKNKYWHILITLYLFLSGCFLNTSISEKDPSAGFNGSFEKIKHHLPLNWTFNAPADYQKNYYLSFDTLNVKEGNQSLKFDVHSVDTSRRTPGMTSWIDAESGEKYKVSFWIKNSGCTFKINIGVPGKGKNSKDFINTKKDFIEWTYFEQDYTVPDHFSFFLFELNISSPGSFWIDDVRIQKTVKNF